MSRQTVLNLLRTQPGAFVSGEQISEKLGLSRTAVWKAVESLRKEGYAIEAHSGLGYRFAGAPDVLSKQEIQNFLHPVGSVGRELLCFDKLDSTNTYAKKIALSGAPDGTVVVTDCQTAGRGRMGREFQSPRERGIYLTVLLRPTLPPEKLPSITAMTAVAVGNAVESVCGIRPDIKWCNDLVLHGKKLCGILTEMSLEGESGQLQYLVIGIGLNVLHEPENFSPEVREFATSLRMELGRFVSRPALAAAEIEELGRLYEALESGNTGRYLDAYRKDCVTLGHEIQILRGDGSREHAFAVDVDDTFGLVVRRDQGEIEVIRSGEASVRGMYGYAE
jgi:BirA family biotin operon repressor/biotin-[acetyl-CoA-carboxylase] ligase